MDNALKSKSKRPNDINILPLSGVGRIPPQAIELEEAVLGALLIDRDALSKVIDILSSESFYVDGHERDDVVANRSTFYKRYLTEYEPYCNRWIQLSMDEARTIKNLNVTFGYTYFDI